MSAKKRQDLPNSPTPEGLPQGLWVVATPIGNLSDMTERARRALSAADSVLCEDTRVTSRLIAALRIERKGRLERFDAHTSREQIDRWVDRMLAGESLAAASDAGTPGISDPAAELVAAARARGVRVTPVPGPSTVAALLSVAGVAETVFSFRGFFPRKDSERVEELRRASESSVSRVFIWFESPERIVESLEVLARMEASAEVLVGKELTKLHETFFSGSALDVSAQVKDEIHREGARGEWAFLVRFAPTSEGGKEQSESWVKALICLLDARVPASEAAKRVSQHFGAPRNEAYKRAQELSRERDSEKSD